MPLNAPLDMGEVLVSSGLDGIFPKGLPVAEVTAIERSDISLFLTVHARPLVDYNSLEEVLLFTRIPGSAPEEDPEDLPLVAPVSNATIPAGNATAPAAPAKPATEVAPAKPKPVANAPKPGGATKPGTKPSPAPRPAPAQSPAPKPKPKTGN